MQHNLNTNTRRHITTLPFAARCTASGYGFICVGGGKHGTFAVITVNPNSTSESDEPLINRGNERTERRPTIKLENFGNPIVNSVSVHKISGNPSLNIRDDVVAILTSNDQTVRVFSLTQHLEADCLDLEFPVNHATISPDGKYLVAVGDYQRAYFFEKVPLGPSQSKISTSKYASSHIQWLALRLVDLHVPKPTQIIGYFATAWSATSSYCAVASESGYITVFSMEAILKDDRDPIPIPAKELALFVSPSSRPDIDNGPGAIRAMLFSPTLDVLVWIEGQGRVCVADLRSGLKSRQVINLDVTESGLIKVPNGSESDVSAPPLTGSMVFEEGEYAYELQYSDLYSSSFGGSEEYLLPSRRLIRVLQANSSGGTARPGSMITPDSASDIGMDYDFGNSRNNAQSRLVAEMARLTNGGNSDLRGSNHETNDDTNLLERASYAELTRRISAAQERHTDRYAYSGDLSADERELLDALTSAAHITPGERPRSIQYRRNTSDTNQGDRSHPEGRNTSDRRSINGIHRPHPFTARRQASIVISSEDPVHPPLPPHQRRHPWGDVASGRSRQQIMDDLEMWRRSPPPAGDLNADINSIRLRRQIDRARERSERLRRSGQLSQRTQHLIQRRMQDTGNPRNGIATQGLCISPDGCTMWVGTTEGIFEMKFNVHSQLQFPSFDMR
jgi:WD40 repeat protein